MKLHKLYYQIWNFHNLKKTDNRLPIKLDKTLLTIFRFIFEPDMPDEVRYRRKFNNTSMSAGDMDFDDINIKMNVNLLLYYIFQN